MAKNFIKDGRYMYLAVPSGVVAGDPVAVGEITGTAITDRDADGNATIDTEAVYDHSVKANDGVGSAVAVGDKIYFTVGDTPQLNKKTSGVWWGYALETITSDGTDTINLKSKNG